MLNFLAALRCSDATTF